MLGREDLLQQISLNSETGLYIDTQNPVSCSGTLTRWNYCYYIPRGTTGSVGINLEIWRLSTGGTLSLVGWHQTRVNISTPSQQIRFRCDSDTLEPEEDLSVMQGDLIGTSIFPPIAAFPVVGDNSPNPSASLLHFPIPFQFPSQTQPLTRMAQSGSNLAGRVLHFTVEMQGERIS